MRGVRLGPQQVPLPLDRVQALERGGPGLASGEALDRFQQPRPVACEAERRVGSTARGDDGGDVVARHVKLDELARELSHLSGSPRVGVQLVEHDGEDAAANTLLVGRDVLRRSRPLRRRRLRAVDGNPDLGEHGDLLARALLEHLEVVAGEAGDDLACLVGDERLHLDVVDLGAKDGGLRRSRGRRLGLSVCSAGEQRGHDEAAK